MNDLVSEGDEGRSRLRKAPGSRQAGFDPGISEWGNPSSRKAGYPIRKGREQTEGSETSQYLLEKKKPLISSVAASERETV